MRNPHVRNLLPPFISLVQSVLELIKCVFHAGSEGTSRDNFPLCLHLPRGEMWPASQIGVFMTDQVACGGRTAAARRECPA